MIGQKKIQQNIKNLIDSGTFPRFAIFTGLIGSGKKLLAKQVARQLGGIVIWVEPKVDGIRDMIEQSYKTNTQTIYIIADADNMSVAAKNAMLKVTEEPPHNAYFIMTLQDIANTLDTIKSRGTEFKMDTYTVSDISACIDVATPKKEANLIVALCDTPLEVQQLKNYGVQEFIDYVKLVVDNIAVVSGTNAFKIANKLALADETDKYDLRLFWKAFQNECMSRITENPYKYGIGISLTSKYLQDIKKSLSKSYTFDMWLFAIRGEWFNYAES